VQLRERIELRVRASDPELLTYDWLNEIIFETVTRGMLFGRFSVKVDDGELHGLAWGEPVDVARHEPAVEIKGATMCELRLCETPFGPWVASCIVDV
jgi:tRNA nucleotidyltransferase (CCA-adding enzyme)